MRIADSIADVIARRLHLVRLIGSSLSLASVSVHSQDMPPPILAHTPIPECACSSRSSLPVAMLMAIALTCALAEFAQLVLLLLADHQAARSCYQNRCSARQCNADALRESMKRRVPSRENPVDHKQPEQNDDISTNIPIAPANLSDDSDTNRTKCRDQCNSPSICKCEQEDYLVAMEDDVRRPCGPSANTELSQHAFMQSPQSTKVRDSIRAQRFLNHISTVDAPDEMRAGASDTTDDTAHEKEEAEHHFKDELLLAAETTPMDAL